jgi:hypothetical protein
MVRILIISFLSLLIISCGNKKPNKLPEAAAQANASLLGISVSDTKGIAFGTNYIGGTNQNRTVR